MIHVKDLHLTFGTQTVFNNVSFSVQQNQRVGLVGANGSGKSTLLKIIAGLQKADDGIVSLSGSTTLAYMPQDVILQSSKTVYEEAVSSFEQLYRIQEELKTVEKLLEKTKTEELTDRYAQLHEELEHHEPHTATRKTKKILQGLGFTPEQQNNPVSQLSVGWKMRLVLAKLLLKDADFYLFDEPTNHLDIVAKDWFLQFLKESNFGFLLVCHDRYFLDKLCLSIIALEHGTAKRYHGNYSDYEQQREQELITLHAAYEQQQRELKQKRKTIERFRAKSSKAKMVKSMERELERTELITLAPSIKQVNFSFPDVERAGRIALQVKHVSHSFGNKQIFKNATFEIERGQKIALVAPNGTGKSTLFNLICQTLPIQTGTIEFGYNVKHALFAQDQNKSLDLDKTILENLLHTCSNKPEKQIRSFLGSFLFSGDAVGKKVGVLSGGEKNKVSMASVLLQDANFLLLDEPTNHLDIQSKDVLLKALNAYHGTILFVSHDRNFINNVATHVIELTPDGTHLYHGNYDSYLYQKKDIHPEVAKKTKNVIIKQKTTTDYETKKQIKKLENKIKKIEKEIAKHEFAFVDLKYGTPKFEENQKELQTLHEKLETYIKKWEKLHEQN